MVVTKVSRDSVAVENDRGDMFMFTPVGDRLVLKSSTWNGDRPADHVALVDEASDAAAKETGVSVSETEDP